MTALEPAWQPLADELARWNGAGRAARFWLRDDDAVELTDALDRLLGLSGAFAVPVTLAVIPALTGDALADRLQTEPRASVAVHGWAHRNHAPEGQKKQELGAHRPRAIVLDELAQGLSRLAGLHGVRAMPMLVPPWNRIDACLIPDLVPLGFKALSAYGPPKPAPIRMLNTNVDLMDWSGARGCRDHAQLVHDIVAQLGRGFDDADAAVGLLTHHLVHDQAAWSFLARLFEISLRSGACWLAASALLDMAERLTTA